MTKSGRSAVLRLPLAGRQALMRRLWWLYEHSHTSGVVLGGPPGIGKSSLLRAVRATARERDCHLVWAAGGWGTREVPFGTIADALPAIPPTATVAEVAARITADGRRLAVVLDDAPMADPSTIAVLHLLVSQRRAFLFTSARDGESLPAPLAELWRAGALEWLAVPPLEPQHVRRLAASALGQPVDGPIGADLVRRSGGNPLFLRELIAGAPEQRMPAPLVELLWQRYAALPPPVVDVVQLVGEAEPLEAELARSAVDHAAVEEAELHGLVHVELDGRRCLLRLTNPLDADVLRHVRGSLRVRRLHGKVAAALAGHGLRRAGDAVRLARYHLDGLVTLEPSVLAQAARHAVGGDHRLAIRLGQAARQAGVGPVATLAVAAGHAWAGEFERADTMFAGLARGVLADADRAVLARDRAVNLFFGMGRSRAARDVIAAAKREIADPIRRAELGLLDAGIAINLGRSAEAFQLATSASAEPGCERLRLRRLPGLISMLAGLGDTAAAIETGDEELARGGLPAGRYPYLLGTAKVALVEACLLHGALDRADEMVAAAYRDHSRQAASGLAGQWALVRARAALVHGRFGEAVEYFREGSMLLDRNLTLLGRSGVIECRAGLALGYAFQSDPVAAALAAAALAAAESTVVEDCFSPTLALARSWIPALSGDRSAGLAAALDAVAANAELGNAGFEAAALHVAALLGAPACVADRLAELAGRHPGPLRQAYAEHAAGVVKHDGVVLDRAAHAFATLGAYPFAAQAATDAARAHAAAGHRSHAVLASERSRAYAARCPGFRPLEPLDPPDVPALTERERQVAQLAAAGLANAEIAGRLVLSVRTVETHLSNVYAKVGRSGRTALQELFTPHT